MKDIPPATTGGESAGETKEASRINQLLQESLRLNNEKNIIGKDELTQLELKVKLAQAIFVLEEDQIKSSMKGREQQIALNNATLAYQVIVGKANDDWAEATQKIGDIGLQVTEITDKILGQQSPDQSPLQKALSDLKREAIDNVQVLEKLRKSIRALAGDRPEGKAALAGIEQAFSILNTQDPLLAGSKRVAGDIIKNLKSELNELNASGKSMNTLDKVILELGDDWKSLSPQIKADLTELAGQVDAAKPFAEIASALRKSREELTKMTSTSTLVISSANSIGDAFGTAFKGVITGSMTAREALAGFFQSLADSFADMVSKMIAEYMKMAIIKGITSLIPGLGSIGGGLGSSASNLDKYAPLIPMANGGVLSGGFQAFANGGIVTGPTLGLVGEGRYNEAVIPLPDGKSVPVDLGGAMGGNITSNIVVNVSSDGKVSSSGGGADAAGFGRKLEGAVKQVIAGELRPGGLLSRRN
jgi:hypothetical protein